MNTKRSLAALELLLIFPASLFMAALFVRNVQPPAYEPAHAAQRLVDWFATHTFLALDMFLIALPFAALVIGGTAVLRGWRSDAQLRNAMLQTAATVRAHLAALLIAAATLAAAGILGIVALHVITD
jgi:hypothetical protein